MYELARIYLGDVSRTLAPGQKLLSTVTAKQSPPSAYLWLSLAVRADHPQAQERLASLNRQIDPDDAATAKRLIGEWRNAPCEYQHVFSQVTD